MAATVFQGADYSYLSANGNPVVCDQEADGNTAYVKGELTTGTAWTTLTDRVDLAGSRSTPLAPRGALPARTSTTGRTTGQRAASTSLVECILVAGSTRAWRLGVIAGGRSCIGHLTL